MNVKVIYQYHEGEWTKALHTDVRGVKVTDQLALEKDEKDIFYNMDNVIKYVRYYDT